MRGWLRLASALSVALIPTLLVGTTQVSAPPTRGLATPGAKRPSGQVSEAALHLATHAGGSSSGGPSGASSEAPALARVLVSGDILVHNTVWQSARIPGGFDFAPLLAGIRGPVRRADLALCHLETPLAAAAGPFLDYPRFSTPPQLAAAIRRTGYDGCTTASNHSVDQGTPGVVRTLDELDRVGLAHAGSARTRREARTITTYDVNGISIAWLAYTFGTNGLPIDPVRPWQVHLIDADRILADAARAKREGADAVLVALHWGEEYQPDPSAAQRALADKLTRSPDITLIYGHHAHVVQPIERLHGTWVAYGLGNLLADQRTIAPGVDDGLLVEFTLHKHPDGSVTVDRPRAFPTRITHTSGTRVGLSP